ncbi:CBM_collapsed_G0052270.mRNA.1.CDS.1 [Saccharomyces cerevisiae]|nr:CBM_collapsed_G0052270.mRNA.1.CDS.1 [Saccharomyces cerevisiae]
MTEIIDLDLVDDFIKKPMVKQQKNQSSKPRVKRRGQLTFDDFRNIKIVEEPVVLSHNNGNGKQLGASPLHPSPICRRCYEDPFFYRQI